MRENERNWEEAEMVDYLFNRPHVLFFVHDIILVLFGTYRVLFVFGTTYIGGFSPILQPEGGCRFAGKANCEISLYRGL